MTSVSNDLPLCTGIVEKTFLEPERKLTNIIQLYKFTSKFRIVNEGATKKQSRRAGFCSRRPMGYTCLLILVSHYLYLGNLI